MWIIDATLMRYQSVVLAVSRRVCSLAVLALEEKKDVINVIRGKYCGNNQLLTLSTALRR